MRVGRFYVLMGTRLCWTDILYGPCCLVLVFVIPMSNGNIKRRQLHASHFQVRRLRCQLLHKHLQRVKTYHTKTCYLQSLRKFETRTECPVSSHSVRARGIALGLWKADGYGNDPGFTIVTVSFRCDGLLACSPVASHGQVTGHATDLGISKIPNYNREPAKELMPGFDQHILVPFWVVCI